MSFALDTSVEEHECTRMCEVAYISDVCRKAFVATNNLNRHKRTHFCEKSCAWMVP